MKKILFLLFFFSFKLSYGLQDPVKILIDHSNYCVNGNGILSLDSSCCSTTTCQIDQEPPPQGATKLNNLIGAAVSTLNLVNKLGAQNVAQGTTKALTNTPKPNTADRYVNTSGAMAGGTTSRIKDTSSTSFNSNSNNLENTSGGLANSSGPTNSINSGNSGSDSTTAAATPTPTEGIGEFNFLSNTALSGGIYSGGNSGNTASSNRENNNPFSGRSISSAINASGNNTSKIVQFEQSSDQEKAEKNVLLSKDPDNYFTQTQMSDLLFKIIRLRYQKIGIQWSQLPSSSSKKNSKSLIPDLNRTGPGT